MLESSTINIYFYNMANKQKTEKVSRVSGGAVGAGVAGLAAAAIGAYWLYGAKNAAKNRKIAASWMLKARAEVMDAVEKMKEMDKDAYLKIVDAVVDKYSKTKSSAEVMAIAKEMRAAWSQISAATKPAKKVARKSVKKTV